DLLGLRPQRLREVGGGVGHRGATTASTDVALVVGPAEALEELVDREVDGRLPVVVLGLGPHHRSLRPEGDLDSFAGLGLTRVVLVTHHDLDALDARFELGHLRELLVEVVPQSIRDVDVASGDGNFHGVLLGHRVRRSYAWRGPLGARTTTPRARETQSTPDPRHPRRPIRGPMTTR